MRTRFFGLLCALALSASAEPVTFQSGPHRVALVELFTSEGCSSCPPADRWVSALRDNPGLWKDFVPVAFHVHYWDQLGWKDRFSSRLFTGRQYAYAESWGTHQVYTPCFVFNGKEWHMDISALRPVDEPEAGTLTLQAPSAVSLTQCTVRYAGVGRVAPTTPKLIAHVALLGGGLETNVKSGENAGSLLSHEFAVLALGENKLAGAEALVTLPAPLVAHAPRTALVAWVTAGQSLVPLQAVGGWIVQ
jgi:hypothetical protein